MKIFATLFITFFLITALCENHAVIIGGSGEINQRKNFFKDDFEIMRGSLKARGWNVESLFNGKKGRLKKSKPASNENISQSISTTLSNAKSGDQVFLVLHSHGSEKKWFQETHSIVSEHPKGFDLDQICQDIEKAEQNGVKVAIADLSCYSGNTQSITKACSKSNEDLSQLSQDLKTSQVKKVHDTNPCVVTLASKDYVSICSGNPTSNSFTRSFIRFPKNGKISLEKHYLNSRKDDNSSSNFPQISSIEAPVKEFWDFFLKNTDPSSYDRSYEIAPGNTEAATCELCNHANLMREFAKKIEELSDEVLKSSIRKEILGYMETVDQLNQVVTELKMHYGSEDSWDFQGNLSKLNNHPLSVLSSIESLLKPKVKLDEIAWLDDGTKEFIEGFRSSRKDLGRSIKVKKKEMEDKWRQYNGLSKALEIRASSLLKLERRLYDELAKPKEGESNCREFML